MVLLHVWRTEPYESGEAFMSEVCDLKAHLQSITEKNRSFYSDPRGIGALKDLQQTFPNPWLYVAELLQNAVDEHATMISATVRRNDLPLRSVRTLATSPSRDKRLGARARK